MARLKLNINPSIQRLDLVVKGLSNSKFMGNYQSVFKGQGLEFADFRTFTSADDASRIDWKTSARTVEPVVKEFVEERNIDIFFLVDVSSKMMLGSTKRLKCEYIADFVASFTHTVLRAGDSVGLALFSDKINKVVYSANGLSQAHVISDVLSNLSFYGGDSSIKTAADYAIENLREGTIVFLVSDFITEENLENVLDVVGHKFDFISVIVRDPLDLDLPVGLGQVSLQDPVYGDRVVVSPKRIAKYYSLEAKSDLRKTKKALFNLNIDVLELSTKEAFVKKVVEFFKRRGSLWR